MIAKVTKGMSESKWHITSTQLLECARDCPRALDPGAGRTAGTHQFFVIIVIFVIFVIVVAFSFVATRTRRSH
jgi:hypothetical protein